MDIEKYYQVCPDDMFRLDLHVSRLELNAIHDLVKKFPFGTDVSLRDLIIFLKYCSRERPSYRVLDFFIFCGFFIQKYSKLKLKRCLRRVAAYKNYRRVVAQYYDKRQWQSPPELPQYHDNFCGCDAAYTYRDYTQNKWQRQMS